MRRPSRLGRFYCPAEDQKRLERYNYVRSKLDDKSCEYKKADGSSSDLVQCKRHLSRENAIKAIDDVIDLIRKKGGKAPEGLRHARERIETRLKGGDKASGDSKEDEKGAGTEILK